jgi:glycosyltransferase involved in cell wall biosynthesis
MIGPRDAPQKMTGYKPVEVVICRSNPVAPDPRVEKCAVALVKAGYSVRIIGWDRSGAHAPIETKAGIHIERIFIPGKFGSGTRNLYAFLRWQIALALWLGRNHKNIHIIHACDFDTVLPAMLMKRLWGVSIIYDIFDFYADHIRSNQFIRNCVRAIDRSIISQVDAVILVDEARRVQIENCPVKRCEIIYNSPPDRLDALKTHHSPRSPEPGFQIGYVGMMLKDRGLLDMLQVLKNHPTWYLELAGFGGDEDLILAAARELSNVHWHGIIDYQKSLELYFNSDVILATYDPSIPNHRLGSPNKIFEAMMLARPVIVAENTNMDRKVQEAGSGLIVRYGDLESLENALQSLCQNPELGSQLGAAGRSAYESQYGWSKMEMRIINLYKNIAEGKKLI